jgi:polygalacturonase
VAAGGGRVTIPVGRFVSRGPVQLQSGVELHLDEGAYLKFSPDPEDYLPNVYCRWEGVNLYNYSPMLYASDAANIAITGKGVIDGGAEIWSTFRQQQSASRAEAWRVGREAVPLEDRQFGASHKLRPPMLHLVNCRRVLVEDVMLTNASFWMIHPVYCEHVTIRGVRCHSLFINNDGVDIDSCADVLIENCCFSTGDDAIAMKAGRDLDAWKTGKPTRNVVVRNCDIPEALHGFAVGSEMSGGVENIFVENLRMGNISQEAVQFKSNKDRGGAIRNVHLRDVSVAHAGHHLLYITNDYHSFQGGQSPTEITGLDLERINCGYAATSFCLQGLAEMPLLDIRLRDIRVEESPCPGLCHVNCEDLNAENIWVNGEAIGME